MSSSAAISHTVVWTKLRGAGGASADVHRVNQSDMAAHDHLFLEIVFVEQGQAVHRTAAGNAPLRPGDVIVLRPQVWHAYEKTRQLRIINCLIDSRLLARFGSMLNTVPDALELYRHRTRTGREALPAHLHARPAAARQLQGRLDQIIQEQLRQPPGWQAAVALGAMDILVSCARLAYESRSSSLQGGRESEPLQGMKRSQQAVVEAVTIIESKYQQPLTLEDLARRVHLSPGHLSRSFSSAMGMSMVSFIHRLRVEEACRLLRGTAEPITRIAAAVGYEEIAYFSRCFRQQLGLSPRQYREQSACVPDRLETASAHRQVSQKASG